MQHSHRFLTLISAAQKHVNEVTCVQIEERLLEKEVFHLIDVREDNEFAKGHIVKSKHMGLGVIERDIEKEIPDLNADIVLYCGGGFRSVLAAESLQKMGYTKVVSMAGGFREWVEKKFPVE
jgi:rhodanese-related sulfurtransferase